MHEIMLSGTAEETRLGNSFGPQSLSPTGCTDSDLVYTRRVRLDHTRLTNLLTFKFLGNKFALISATRFFSLFSVNW